MNNEDYVVKTVLATLFGTAVIGIATKNIRRNRRFNKFVAKEAAKLSIECDTFSAWSAKYHDSEDAETASAEDRRIVDETLLKYAFFLSEK